jgi:hypothetical protein
MSLEYCLASIAYQLQPGDEVLVIGDTTDGPLPQIQQLVDSFDDTRLRYLPAPSTQHSWGHRELNYGIRQARGDWLSFNDDDDIWTPGAADSIRAAAETAAGRPLLLRFMTYHGYVAWTNRAYFAETHVGGHCIVCPNVPDKLGVWTDRYQGDWDFIKETVDLHGGEANIIWREEIIALARPTPDVLQQVLVQAGRTPA